MEVHANLTMLAPLPQCSGVAEEPKGDEAFASRRRCQVPGSGYAEAGRAPRGSRPVHSDLGRCECQHDRQGQKHCARLVVSVGVNLLVRQLDLPSRQDLVALEALANMGQSLIKLRAVGSEKRDGEKQSGSELRGIRRPSGRFKLRDLHDQRFRRLVSRLQAEMPIDRGLQLGSVRGIGI